MKSLQQRWSALSRPTRGAALMILSTLCFAAMHATIRHATKDLHPFVAAFFRNAFGLIVFLPIVYRQGFGFMRTRHIGLHLMRAVLNVASMLCFFTGLSMTPIARATALSFTSPIFAAVLSVLFLGERFRIRRWTAIFFGFLGAMIILRPGVAEVDFGSMLILGSAITWSVAMIIIKILGRRESSLTITGYVTVFLTLMSLPPALYHWQTPVGIQWLWLMVIAIAGTLGQLCVAQSLRDADATALMPFDFLKLIWAALLGFVLFAEIPDVYTWIGAAVVFSSSVYIAYRESVVKRKKQADGSHS